MWFKTAMPSRISKPKMRLKGLTLSFFTMAALLLSIHPLPNSYCKPTVKVFIYGFARDSLLTNFYYEYFTQEFGTESATVKDLNDVRNREEFLNICIRVIASGVNILPSGPSVCSACELSHSSFEDLLIRFSYPAVLIFVDGRLETIAFSKVETEELDDALANPNKEGLLIITPERSQLSNDEGLRSYLENMMLSSARAEGEGNEDTELLKVLLPVLSLALVDSINPCTFVLFTALLLMVHMTFGRRERTLQTGLLFSAAVFLGYYLLGVGFVSLLKYAVVLKLLVVLIGMTMSALSIALGLKGADKCPMPKPLKELLMGRIFERSQASRVAAFALGLLSSFTLLPCSSGPYLVGITYMQSLEKPGATYALLTAYNTVFVMPLVAISFLVFFFEDAFDKIDSFKRTNLGVIELISGFVLGALCLYLLLELLAELGVTAA